MTHTNNKQTHHTGAEEYGHSAASQCQRAVITTSGLLARMATQVESCMKLQVCIREGQSGVYGWGVTVNMHFARPIWYFARITFRRDVCRLDLV